MQEQHQQAAQCPGSASTCKPVGLQLLRPGEQHALPDATTTASADTSVHYLEPVLRGVSCKALQAVKRHTEAVDLRASIDKQPLSVACCECDKRLRQQPCSCCQWRAWLSSNCLKMLPCAADLGLQQWQLQDGEATAILNSLHELVHVHQQLLSSREDLQDELHRMRVEAKTADKTIQRLQASNDQKTQELGGVNIKASSSSACWQYSDGTWQRSSSTHACTA